MATGRTAERLRLEISGAVQGVGFRPFVYRLARLAGLNGWVLNDSRGVILEVEGEREPLEAFAERLRSEAPANAVLHHLEARWLPLEGFSRFEIRSSDESGEKNVAMTPDVATCDACRSEVLQPTDRRYGYPFTNCTDCGPRFTIIEALPYDRPFTTMRGFVMCESCRREYEDPEDRRFHAQPNACPECGPRLELLDSGGETLATARGALERAARAVLGGEILAVKGLGGFHLLVDAANDSAVERLRRRKGRYEKPLALMVVDTDQARALVDLSEAAASLLVSAQAPIVLLPALGNAPVAPSVAPGNPNLGVMLPYTPLHHLLLRAVGLPVVATSGNLSDEPITIDNNEALDRLGSIADLFLVHDRPIARHVDDSVFHLVEDRPQPLRRARGWAPLPVTVRRSLPPILALGAHLKNTVALSVGESVFLSQHIGDMETPQAIDAFERVICDFLELYETAPVAIARDLHPDYYSSRWVASREALTQARGELPIVAVQHHHAHLAGCLAENDVEGRALGVTWDGTGYGTDETVWGGEFLFGDARDFERVASLRPFRLPGADAAVREPGRIALALLWQLEGAAALERDEIPAIRSLESTARAPFARMLETGFGAPVTTSAGRLFDGVAALLGVRQRVAFEGQAAMELEFLVDRDVHEAYPLPLATGEGTTRQLDWRPLVEAILEDARRDTAVSIMAGRFHRALVDGILAVAVEIGEPRVALTGGCFQNRLLTEWAAERLRGAGFEVLMHRRIPANDGGISFGQVMVASERLEQGI